MRIEFSQTSELALSAMTDHIVSLVNNSKSKAFHIALSGGGTAQAMFRLWAARYGEALDWGRLHFWWVDERCVGPDDEQSNYGYAETLLFKLLAIERDHIHRIWGENDPEAEAIRYSALSSAEVPQKEGFPAMDCTILGIGDDMHTASIFPSSMELLADSRSYAVGIHPTSGQRRITMTGPTILASAEIVIPVFGESKRHVIEALNAPDMSPTSPSAYIVSMAKDVKIYTDIKL